MRTMALSFLLVSLWGCKAPDEETKPEHQDSTPEDSEVVEPIDTEDTGLVYEARTIDATSPTGIHAEVTVDTLDALGAGVDIDEFALSWVEDSEGILFGGETVRDLAGGVLVVEPEGLGLTMPLELQLSMPDGLLGDDENPAQVFAARCVGDIWVPSPLTAATDDSITVRIEDTEDHCSMDLEQGELPPPPSLTATGVGIGYSDGWVNTMSVDAPLEPGGTTSFTFDGWWYSGTVAKLYLDGSVLDARTVEGYRAFTWSDVALGTGQHAIAVVKDDLALWYQTLIVGTSEEPEPYESLLQAWAPIIEFAEDEEHFPVALDAGFFPSSVDILQSLSDTRVLTVSGSDALSTLAVRGHDTFLMDDGDNVSNSGSIDDITVYASAHHLDDGRLALQYWMFYLHDPKSGILDGAVAAHNRDRESVIVVLEEDYSLDEVIYAGHGGDHWMCVAGSWTDDTCSGEPWGGGGVRVPAREVVRECERPVIYVASGSHALYPRNDEYSISVSGWSGPYFDEWAGGGERACPSGVSGTCSSGSGGYELELLPSSGQLDSNAELGLLLFSGYWVDGPLGSDSRFPPMLDRFAYPSEWIANLSDEPSATEADYDVNACDDDVETECSDGIDNDGDGDIDCDDSDCAAFGDCGPKVTEPEVTYHEGIAMALIPPGTFSMGSPEGEEGHMSMETQHNVTLTGGFYIGLYEVTQGEFEGFMGYQPSDYSGCADCPAEDMNWYEAAAFANAVSTAAGLTDCYTCSGSGSGVDCELSSIYTSPYDCDGYRLPTEAEWEYAARAGTTSAFSNGGNLNPGEGTDCSGSLVLDNGTYLDDIGLYCGNASGHPEPVGMLDANPWGLYDMHGSVYEWCHDYYDEYEGDEVDPWGPTSGVYVDRVRRGGSWDDPAYEMRSANRQRTGRTSDYINGGFRVARSE